VRRWLIIAALAIPAAADARPSCRRERAHLSLGGDVGIAFPFPVALGAFDRQSGYGNDVGWINRGVRLAAGLRPFGCLELGAGLQVQTRREATTRTGEVITSRAEIASGRIGFRLGGVDRIAEIGASVAFGAMRATTTLRGAPLTRTVPWMAGHIEVVVGRGPNAVSFYWENPAYFNSEAWGDYTPPGFGGMSLGVAFHRRL
jgi:hypothetical protein